MHKLLLGLLLLSIISSAQANDKEVCSGWPSWTKPACKRLHQVWTEGKNEVYVSGYAWHNRYTYTREKAKTYNETAWGGGLGKGLYDEKGNWHGLFAIAFQDSHNKTEPAVGYAFLKVAHPTPNLGLGVGYTILVTARPDIYHNIPFPGILPWASINFRNLALSATYIPGAAGAGNVLYVVGKWTINW